MSVWSNQSIRYVALRQTTSAPSGYVQTPAVPDAISTIARNATWPTKTDSMTVSIPVDGRVNTPTSAVSKIPGI